jgi:hypothetical protein
MELNQKLFSSLALLTSICCAGLAAEPAKASVAMEVLGNQVMAEDMILNDNTYVSLGTVSKSFMPFNPKLNYPSHVTLQAIIHVKNPFPYTINLSKVGFNVYTYDPWTRHKHYVTTVIRHISPEAQKFLHIPAHAERHSPPNAPSLRFHVPYASLFHESSLYASPFESVASTLNVVGEDDGEALTIMNVVSAANSERNLEFSLGSLDVQGIPVPGPLALAGPWVACHFASAMRKRTALRMTDRTTAHA